MQILGVNAPGAEAGNPAVTTGRDLPWLQDTLATQAAVAWGITERDVVVLDAQNRPYAVYNVTVHDLAIPANYDELRSILLAAAAASAP